MLLLTFEPELLNKIKKSIFYKFQFSDISKKWFANADRASLVHGLSILCKKNKTNNLSENVKIFKSSLIISYYRYFEILYFN